ncbi:hypothetical protein CTEN210_12782 [Chaetoceros tenuissimus]|uniref:Uncharacterized protein n=1 Tax=Chaetoceros tenuissimus TaxID=426638 RepID=A0AAD3D1W0_9STRA|nr:hypothetical protein CTEN210_12782 [Chaetoceros tenuissimus]
MYKLKGISRRAIIASLALFGLFAIFGTDDTYGNVPMRNLEENKALGVCHGWCLPHPDPWDMKCTFKNCVGCSKCAELEEEKKEEEENNQQVSSAKYCDGWCHPHSDPWDMKCTFKRCNGCGQCLEQEEDKPLEKEEIENQEVSENNCDDWCFSETNPFEWHAKCTFRRCNGCSQCFEEEKKDETLSQLDGTDSNPIIVVEEEQQEEEQQEKDNEQPPRRECQSWCLPHPDPWDMKCTFKHCDGCDKCLEEKPADLSNPDQNRFVGWGTDLERYLMTHL